MIILLLVLFPGNLIIRELFVKSFRWVGNLWNWSFIRFTNLFKQEVFYSTSVVGDTVCDRQLTTQTGFYLKKLVVAHVHYRVRKGRAFFLVLYHLAPIRPVFKFCFNIIITSPHRSSRWRIFFSLKKLIVAHFHYRVRKGRALFPALCHLAPIRPFF